MQVHFLHGTEMGNAEMLCEDMVKEFSGSFSCSAASLAEVSPADLSADIFYVFVVSTYGSGDLPQTAQPFYDALNSGPDLSGIRFAIFGLGDRAFGDTFNQGSETVLKKLIELGAQHFGERGVFDASGSDFPEDVALPWAKEIFESLSVSQG